MQSLSQGGYLHYRILRYLFLPVRTTMQPQHFQGKMLSSLLSSLWFGECKISKKEWTPGINGAKITYLQKHISMDVVWQCIPFSIQTYTKAADPETLQFAVYYMFLFGVLYLLPSIFCLIRTPLNPNKFNRSKAQQTAKSQHLWHEQKAG